LIDGRRRLTKVLGVALDEGADPVTATRVWFERDTLAQAEELTEEGSEPGFLEMLADMEAALTGLNEALIATASINEAIAAVATEAVNAWTRQTSRAVVCLRSSSLRTERRQN